VRHLVRWHRRLPEPPGVRLVAVATALVMAFVAIPDPGLVAHAPEVVRMPVAPPTALDGSAGSLAAISLGVTADVRWRVIDPVRLSPSPVPAIIDPGCDPVAVAVAQNGIDTLGGDDLAALLVDRPGQVSATLDTGCPTAGALLSWYLSNQQLAIAKRAEARREARVEQQRVDRHQRLVHVRRAARRGARHRSAARRAAIRAAKARAAKRSSATRGGSGWGGTTGPGSTAGDWRIAPIVTWYGPGFYGNRTACGVPYTRTIVGVAHRTLPCGTLVRFQWHGMTTVAPVIDRGPYASAAYVFDFSAALSCNVLRPRGISNSCFTRHDVKYRVVGRVNLRQYLAAHGH